MATITRRGVLKGALAAAGGTLAAPFTIAGTKSTGRVLGANDTIRVGVAGLHGRGGGHIAAFSKIKNVQVTHLIDPDSRELDRRAGAVRKAGRNKPKCFQDIRKALADKELDAVSVATCNHWHSLITVWACQAGKDVYVEKPCSHNVFEGRQCVEAAKKYGRIVQHGTQQRSGRHYGTLKDIAAGKRGKLAVVRAFNHKRRGSIGFKKPSDPPAALDFDIWLGPAPKQPYHGNLVHYNWHWFWDTGNGDIGNNGVHAMDLARWTIPNATLPKSVISLGGRLGYKDQAQTPNTQIAVYDFGETFLIFDVRGLPTKGKNPPSLIFDKTAPAKPIEIKTVEGVKSPIAPRGPGGDIFGNFIHCVRTRKSEDLDAHILEGHYSAALCHLANISYRLGKEVPFNPKTKAFGDNKAAYETFGLMLEHLKDNGIKLDSTTYHLGRRLVLDPEKETVLNDPEANRLLTREYRTPYVVPEKV